MSRRKRNELGSFHEPKSKQLLQQQQINRGKNSTDDMPILFSHRQKFNFLLLLVFLSSTHITPSNSFGSIWRSTTKKHRAFSFSWIHPPNIHRHPTLSVPFMPSSSKITSTTQLDMKKLFRKLLGKGREPNQNQTYPTNIHAMNGIEQQKDDELNVPLNTNKKMSNSTMNLDDISSSTNTMEETINNNNITSETSTHLSRITLDPTTQAKEWKEQAERFRYEAEKMDLILTLSKITKLEKELNLLQSSSTEKKQGVEVLEQRKKKIEDQLNTLKLKLTASNDKSESHTTTRTEDNQVREDTSTLVELSTTTKLMKDTNISASVFNNMTESLPSTDTIPIEEMVQSLEKAPTFMRSLVYKAMGYSFNEHVNITDIAKQLIFDDYVFRSQHDPNKNIKLMNPTQNADTDESIQFSQNDIDDIVDFLELVPSFMKSKYSEEIRNNNTAIALDMLKDDWREKRLKPVPSEEEIKSKIDQVKWIPSFLRGDNITAFAIEVLQSDRRVETLSNNEEDDDSNNDIVNVTHEAIKAFFPTQITEDGRGPKAVVVKRLIQDVLAKDKIWTVSTQPEKVPGGYIIRGTTKFSHGDDLIDSIYKKLMDTRLNREILVHYINDPTEYTDEDRSNEDSSPVLYVTGANVRTDVSPILLALISATALGTSWYNALFPCLLNEKMFQIVEEQLALADASMQFNLDLVQSMAVPIFLASLTIHLSHELAHRTMAMKNNLNITVPTIVPSLVTGVTGTITSLKSPAKNNEALFDFSIAGPLTGMILSVLFLIYGLILMKTMDAASYESLPALPLQILRQSSLGGGIIDAAVPGLLVVPDGAVGTSTVASINIPLHPFSIAGYFGLLVNALNLLPVGRTDGGRISMIMFGRGAAPLVTFLTMAVIFIQGLRESDYLLFFFSFVVFFQSELDIPTRNEVDDISFGRILLAIACGTIVLLTLIPM